MPATTVTAVAPSTRGGRRPAGPGRTILKPEHCLILLEDRCPAYIAPERFWANQQRVAADLARAEEAGAVRQGPSLLGGILRGGRCGKRMIATSRGPANDFRYNCGRALVDYAEPVCQGLAGRVLDDLAADQVLAALEPAALELSLAAVDDIEQERARLHRNRPLQVELARYEAERTERQYDAVEPDYAQCRRTAWWRANWSDSGGSMRNPPIPGGHWVNWADADELDRTTRIRMRNLVRLNSWVYFCCLSSKYRDSD